MRYLLCLALVACSPIPTTVQLDNAWTEDEASTIASAVYEWEQATCGGVRMDVHVGYTGEPGDGEFAIYRVSNDFLDGDTMAMTWGDSIAVAYDKALAYPDPSVVLHYAVLHELGHVIIGHGHDDSRPNLMNSKPHPRWRGGCIDSYTLELACAEVDCGECARPTCDLIELP